MFGAVRLRSEIWIDKLGLVCKAKFMAGPWSDSGSCCFIWVGDEEGSFYKIDQIWGGIYKEG